MSHPKEAPLGFYFYSIIFKNDEDLKKLSLPDLTFYPEFTPSFDYYEKEMGEGLKRVFFFYTKNLISQDEMISLKLKAYDLEQKTGVASKRTINIDPGFMTLDQMFLTTFKWAPFRLYHSEGIYLDLQYLFMNKSYQGTAWCYPDYLDVEKIHLFNEVRKKLKQSL